VFKNVARGRIDTVRADDLVRGVTILQQLLPTYRWSKPEEGRVASGGFA
jgi:hypothetical protein